MINRVESIFWSYREFYKIPSIKNTVWATVSDGFINIDLGFQ